MMATRNSLCLLTSLAAASSLVAAPAESPLEADAVAVLQRRCLSCHGTRTKTSGLDLSSRASAEKGGSKGSALGSLASSLLLNRVLKAEMPPGNPLPEGERQILTQWIKDGAPWREKIGEMRAGPDCSMLAGLKTASRVSSEPPRLAAKMPGPASLEKRWPPLSS